MQVRPLIVAVVAAGFILFTDDVNFAEECAVVACRFEAPLYGDSS